MRWLNLADLMRQLDVVRGEANRRRGTELKSLLMLAPVGDLLRIREEVTRLLPTCSHL
jgi:hypothetical protein